MTHLDLKIRARRGEKKLRLSSQHITDLPIVIRELRQLEELHLNDNALKYLPDEICELKNLRVLSLNGNQLDRLPARIGDLEHLTSLHLNDNCLSELPESLGRLQRLEHLSLRRNQLVRLPDGLAQLAKLRHLSLRGNQLQTLPEEIGRLESLERLFLSDNRLAKLPDSIGDLKRLQWLFLDRNVLESLPSSLERLAQHRVLLALFLHGNDQLNLPPEVLGLTWEKCQRFKGSELAMMRLTVPAEILSYYFKAQKRALCVGTRPLNEAKILVLGEAEVGKSSVILALTEGKLDQPLNRTHGIVRTKWVVEHPGVSAPAPTSTAPTERLQFNIWDFGGQEVYHSTHAFFLTERAIYVIVADARANDGQNNLDYWIQMAVSFGGGAPIWVVVNKTDQRGDGPDQHALLRKFGGVLHGFVRTSCRTGDGLKKLRQCLVDEAMALVSVRQPMNNTWLSIKSQLESRGADTMAMSDYVQLCHEAGESDGKMQRQLLDLWDKLGIVRYFPTEPDAPPEMSATAIINPEWVTKAVYAVLDDPELSRRNGVLTQADLATILEGKGYQPGRHHLIEQVMRRFRLIYDTREHGRMLVPQLLPEHQPAIPREREGTLRFIYRYPVLPPGLIPTFIAQMSEHLADAPGPWRHGCVLELRGCRVLVIGDKQARQVEIVVSGPGVASRDALDRVRFAFEDIHGGIRDLQIEEYVPVPRRPDAPLLNYQYLRKLELNGRHTHAADGATSDEVIDVNIREVLNGVRGESKQEQERVPCFEQHVYGDLIMNDKKTVIKVGTNYGQVGEVLTQCTNIVGSQPDGEVKRLQEQLQGEIVRFLDTLPESEGKIREKVAKKLKTVLEATSEQEPERKWYSVTAEGLLEAATFTEDFAKKIGGTLSALGKVLWPDFSLGGGTEGKE